MRRFGHGTATVVLAAVALIPASCTDFPTTVDDALVFSSTDTDTLLDEHTDSRRSAGSDMTLLIDGPSALAAFKDLIRSAEDHINIETLTFHGDGIVSDDLAVEFVAMLIEKVREGVQVNLIVDPVGQLIYAEPELIHTLREQGVNVRSFQAVNDDLLLDVFYYRTHKKILVADGTRALLGGRNIGPGYFDDQHWRDTTVLLTGPVVGDVQREFLRDWQTLGGGIGDEARYFPPVEPTGTLAVRSVDQRPAQRDFDINTAVLIAVRGARERIDIETPYLNPTYWLFDELAAAAGRGVAVRVMTNSEQATDFDASFVADAYWFGPLIENGVRVFLWDQPDRLMHSKVMAVDDDLAMVGSYNFNFRSITWDAETAVIFTDPAPVAEIADMLDDDFGAGDVFEVTAEWLNMRPEDEREQWQTAHIFSWLF